MARRQWLGSLAMTRAVERKMTKITTIFISLLILMLPVETNAYESLTTEFYGILNERNSEFLKAKNEIKNDFGINGLGKNCRGFYIDGYSKFQKRGFGYGLDRRFDSLLAQIKQEIRFDNTGHPQRHLKHHHYLTFYVLFITASVKSATSMNMEFRKIIPKKVAGKAHIEVAWKRTKGIKLSKNWEVLAPSILQNIDEFITEWERSNKCNIWFEDVSR